MARSPLFARVIFAALLLSALAPEPWGQSFAVFEEPVGYPSDSPTDIAVGDVDQDGLVDLVVGQSFQQGTTEILRGLGAGTFAPVASVPGSLAVKTLSLHDFNGDGDLDLIQSKGGTVLLQNGMAGFGFGPAITLIAGVAEIKHRTADVDGDGDLDVLAGVASFGGSPPSGIHVLLNDGTGAFTNVELVSNIDGAIWHDVGDVDNDGALDVVWCTSENATLKYALGEGAGQFGPPRFITPVDLNPLTLLFSLDWFALADFDVDGDLDVAWIEYALDELRVMRGNGDGTFEGVQITATPMLNSGNSTMQVADVSRNGLPDVLISSSGAGAHLLEGNGDGTFNNDLTVQTGPSPESPVLADLDGDGVVDLAVSDDTLDEVGVHLNHSYGPGSPFTDLGASLKKPWSGKPILLAGGAPVAGQTISLDLHTVSPVDTAALILGFSLLSANFKGGRMVPFPDVILGPLPTDPDGTILLSATWPVIPGGFPFWAQWWVTDSSLTNDFASSTGLRCDVP
jgi:hypothetical protein